ncbi:hypothetical protein NSMM_980015 [Nitrosomonas mobilis]|uniref:Uncharacterized protein n=1 Tax=Nitrosomonas mobilis TaxID=51642 RepID=A0A1G5SJ86_9PROT|nr:hypothetical protein NSMM_980015 [Nitrosomonas mobilis]
MSIAVYMAEKNISKLKSVFLNKLFVVFFDVFDSSKVNIFVPNSFDSTNWIPEFLFILNNVSTIANLKKNIIKLTGSPVFRQFIHILDLLHFYTTNTSFNSSSNDSIFAPNN